MCEEGYNPEVKKQRRKRGKSRLDLETRQVPTLKRFRRHVKLDLEQPSSSSELLLCFLDVRRP